MSQPKGFFVRLIQGGRSLVRTKKSIILQSIERLRFPILTRAISIIEAKSFRTFSAYGEDALISGLLKRYTFVTGESLDFSYIDIGAWKPVRDSNTYFLYKIGLYGTAVEPNPNLRHQWRVIRPKDHFLGFGCSDNTSETLHLFHSNASSNTFSNQFAKDIESSQNLVVANTIEVECLTLSEIVKRHKSKFFGPYFLDIDVEGFDLKVLRTYDFKEDRPAFVLIEDTAELANSDIRLYLEKVNYQLVGRTVITSLYIDLTQDFARVLRTLT
jgi:FkbM family methyltransferase